MAPLLGAVLAGVFGTKFGGNWIGRRLSHSLTILGVLLSFILSAMTLKSVALDGARFNETIYTWMVVGGLKMEIGFLVDSLTAMMMSVVTSVLALRLKAVFGRRIAPIKLARSFTCLRSVLSILSIVPRDVMNMTIPPGRTFSSPLAKK